jgi:hypothetical protein
MLIIPATWEVKVGVLWFKAIPSQKLVRPYLKYKLGMIVHPCCPSYLEGRDRRIGVRGQPQSDMRLYLKNKLEAKGLGVWLKGKW